MAWNNIKSFKFWCQKVLPLVYDDSLSYYETLCKMVTYINDMIANQGLLADELVTMGTDIETLKEDTLYLKTELEKVKNGEYESMYINALKNYIDSHLEEIVGRIVKFVSFGISADGYFTALIPNTWNFIKFDTIIDTESEFYGHLILNW